MTSFRSHIPRPVRRVARTTIGMLALPFALARFFAKMVGEHPGPIVHVPEDGDPWTFDRLLRVLQGFEGVEFSSLPEFERAEQRVKQAREVGVFALRATMVGPTDKIKVDLFDLAFRHCDEADGVTIEPAFRQALSTYPDGGTDPHVNGLRELFPKQARPFP